MDSDGDERMDTDSGNEFDGENSDENQHTQHLIVGKIERVYLKNFLTHTEATVHPSEQLNLVSSLCSFFHTSVSSVPERCVRFSTLSAVLLCVLYRKNFTSLFCFCLFLSSGYELGDRSKWNGKIVDRCIDYHWHGW